MGNQANTDVAASPPTYPFGSPGLEIPPEFARLRATEPVSRVIALSGNEAWLLTRHDDIRRVLEDRRFRLGFPGAPQASEEVMDDNNTLFQDPPRHTELRRRIAGVFTSARIARLEQFAVNITDQLCRAAEDQAVPVDLVEAFAAPFPAAVIAELIGIEVDDRDRFRSWCDVVLRLQGRDGGEVAEAWTQMQQHVDELADEQREPPPGSLVEALTRDRGAGNPDAGHGLTASEVSGLLTSLLVAGYATTVTALSSGTLMLLADPQRYAELVETPDLIPDAVEELLRYQSERDGLVRIATEDVILRDTLIRRGEAVIAPLAAAGHDEAVFSHPNRYDPHRSSNPHLAFGHGIHRCVGAALARLELRVALRALVEHWPSLTLAVAAYDVPWRHSALDPAPLELPVRLGPPRQR